MLYRSVVVVYQRTLSHINILDAFQNKGTDAYGVLITLLTRS